MSIKVIRHQNLAESGILFQIDYNHSKSNQDFKINLDLIHHGLNEKREPYLRLPSLEVQNVHMGTLPIPGYEDDDELTKKNTYLKFDLVANLQNDSVIEFLHQFEKSCSDEGNWFSGWISKLSKDKYSICLKVTDCTELYGKMKSTTSQSRGKNGKIKLILCRVYDLISKEFYWSVYQISM